MRQLEGRSLATDGAKPKGKDQPTPYDKTKQAGTNGVSAVPQAYNADADVAVPEVGSVLAHTSCLRLECCFKFWSHGSDLLQVL